MKPKTSPPGRENPAMAYDSTRRRVVLFGGAQLGTPLNDTWTWDGANWTRQKPNRSPSPRQFIAMADDPVRGRVVLFGGSDYTYTSTYHNDTWEWDGSNWLPVLTGSAPSARRGYGLVYDAPRQRTLLFGGEHLITSYNDTWEWDGRAWSRVATTVAPQPRRGHGMLYDSARRSTIVFGGRLGGQLAHLSDTWELATPFLPLVTNASTVSLAAHRTQKFTLDAGTRHANKIYFLLGTLSGTTPGIKLSKTVTLPLNNVLDPYLAITLAFPNSPLLVRSLGRLGASGRGTAQWTAIPQIPLTLIGKRFHHAFVVIGTDPFDMASNAVRLDLIF